MADDQTPTGQFADIFDRARDIAAHEKHLAGESEHLDTETKIRVGKLGLEASHKIVNQARVDQLENTPEGREKRRQRDQLMVAEVLAQMDDRMRVLEAQMAERYLILQAKYGEDAIGGMAAEFLGDEAESLTTDEERLRALADRFLDGHGEIKPQYQGMTEALFIQDWNEYQMLAPVVNKFGGHNAFSDEATQEILAIAEGASLSAIDSLSMPDSPDKVAVAGAEAADNVLAGSESIQNDSPLVFK